MRERSPPATEMIQRSSTDSVPPLPDRLKGKSLLVDLTHQTFDGTVPGITFRTARRRKKNGRTGGSLSVAYCPGQEDKIHER